MKEVVLPELGEGIEEATVACWHFKPSDSVKEDDDILEVVTDKATFNIQAGYSGALKELFVKEGENVKIGSVLAHIESNN